jgi:predicted metallopeptidase
MCKESYIKTLLHELTHLAQWVDGSLRFRHGKMCYCQEPVENYDYEYQPHEIEARESEEILYDLYLNEKEGVPVKRVAQQSFSNRLCAL